MKYRITESRLRGMIREAVRRALNETPLNYDIDNFSGRHYKDSPEEFVDTDGYLDDPTCKSDIEYEMFEDPYYDNFPSREAAENDYSWDLFNKRGVAPGAFGSYNVTRRGLDNEIDNIMTAHSREGQWSDKELRNGNKNMERWVQGRRTTDSVGDSWEDLHDFQ